MSKLTVTQGSRVHRTYGWCLDVWLEYIGQARNRPLYERGDNLCHFVRVMVLGAPTAIAAQFICWGLVAYCVFVAPSRWFGWLPYLEGLGMLVAAIGLICGAVFAWCFAWDALCEWRRRGRPDEEVEPVEKISGFAKLARAYRESSIHDKICPHIEFVEEGE